MSLVYPRAFQSYFNQLPVSRQKFRQRPVSSQTSANLGDTIVIDLPASGAYVDLDTLVLQGQLTSTFAAPTTFSKLSSGIESLVDNIVVENGAGTILDAGPGRSLNQIIQTLMDFQVGTEHRIVRGALENERVIDPQNNHNLDRFALQLGNTAGMLATLQPRCVDLSLVNFRIYIKLAGREVFIAHDGQSATPNDNFGAQLSDLMLTYDAIDVLDGGLLADSQQKRISERGFLEMPYTRWYTSSTGLVDINDNQYFSVGSRSIDGILGLMFDATSQLDPNVNVDYSFLQRKCGYFLRSVGRAVAGVKTANTLASSQFTFAGVPYPSWPQAPHEIFVSTMQAFGAMNDCASGVAPWMNSLNSFLYQGFCHYVPLNLYNAEPELRLSSGVSASGATGAIQWITTGTTGTVSGAGYSGDWAKVRKQIWVKTTALLRVGAMKEANVLL